MKKYFLLIVVLIIVGWFATMPYRIKRNFLNSEQFRVAKEFLKHDTVLISEIGTIKSIGDNISGKIDNTKYIYYFNMDVEGEKGIRRAHVNLEKTGSGWKVTRTRISLKKSHSK